MEVTELYVITCLCGLATSALQTKPFNLAVLRAKMKIKNKLPPGSGPESAQNHQFPKENVIPDPPRTPVGGVSQEKKKIVLGTTK